MKTVLDYITPEMREALKNPSSCWDYEFTDDEIDAAFIEHATYRDSILECAQNMLTFRYRGNWDVIDDKHSALMYCTYVHYLNTLVERGLLVRFDGEFIHPTKVNEYLLDQIKQQTSIIYKMADLLEKHQKRIDVLESDMTFYSNIVEAHFDDDGHC